MGEAHTPRATRVYQNHHLDSTRWDAYRARPDDIIIATAYKAGTTWMQRIASLLVFQETALSQPIMQASPWLDARFFGPVDEMIAGLEAQTHRRFVKTHLALDGLRFVPEARYIVVSRDARDVFMSMWNHYTSFTDGFFEHLNGLPGRVGDPLPRPPETITEYWRIWATRGWFDWESDGWPYWSHLHHARTWWEWRHLPNILHVHYADLLADLDGEMRRIAAFLGIGVDEARWPALVEAATFKTMRAQAEALVPGAERIWDGGAAQFIYKGTNGRWRDVLSAEDLALYAAAADRTLTPALRHWIENGRRVAGDPSPHALAA